MAPLKQDTGLLYRHVDGIKVLGFRVWGMELSMKLGFAFLHAFMEELNLEA